MANKTIRVRLKKVNDPSHPENDDILHPETEWSLVEGRPSINEFRGAMDISPKDQISIEIGGDILLKTSDTENKTVSLAWYPIRWDAINGKPRGNYLISVGSSAIIHSPKTDYVDPGVYFYKRTDGYNLIAFVLSNSTGVWGFYLNEMGRIVKLGDEDLKSANGKLTALAVGKYTFRSGNFL